MICPLMSNRKLIAKDCVKEECAWYNKCKEECYIKTVSIDIEEAVEGQRIIFTREV